MTNLFKLQNFKSHTGLDLDFKIDCDALTNEDWDMLAAQISKRISFKMVFGIPTSGLKLARALDKYIDPNSDIVLIVDDVMTTGSSFVEFIDFYKRYVGNNYRGMVVFDLCGTGPSWVESVFRMW